jgi:hypothetical protein
MYSVTIYLLTFPTERIPFITVFVASSHVQLQRFSNYMSCSGSVDSEINIRLNARQIRWVSM